ncbi:MAG: lipocalin family protein [Ferruginibacter sp.]|nr:lipocalin family protein [Chitinophagaceae bacterium]
MNKNIFSLLTCFTAILFLSGSCGKDDDPPAPTKTELITQSTWRFQSATYNGIDVSTSPQLACFIDNTVIFTPTNYTVSEGSVICSPTTAGTNTWTFQSGETVLAMGTTLIPGGSGTFTIVSLTSTNLVLQQTATIPPSPTPGTVVLTFKH